MILGGKNDLCRQVANSSVAFSSQRGEECLTCKALTSPDPSLFVQVRP